MTVDYSVQEPLRKALLENERMRSEPERAVEIGGGGGDSGGMDGFSDRVKALETKVDSLDVRLVRVELRLEGVETRMGGLETRMDRFESRLDGIDDRLRNVERSNAAIDAKLTILTTQVIGKLPTWWQMPAVIGSTIVVIGALWAAGRYLAKTGIL